MCGCLVCVCVYFVSLRVCVCWECVVCVMCIWLPNDCFLGERFLCVVFV